MDEQSFSYFDDGGNSADDGPSAEINTTPLIDVLLVLLVMIIVTIPIRPHLTDLALASASKPHDVLPPVVVAIDDGGAVWWAGQPVADDAALDRLLTDFAHASDPPTLHLKVADQAKHGAVMRVMAAVRRHGITRFGLVDSVLTAALPEIAGTQRDFTRAAGMK